VAITERIPTTLDAKKFIPEIFSKNVAVAAKSKVVISPFLNSSYEKELRKGDTLYIPKTTIVTATEVTTGTRGKIQNPFNTAAVTLSIDQYWEALAYVDTMSQRQSQADLLGKAEDECAYALAKKIDVTCGALFSALRGGTVAGTDGSAWTDDVLVAAVEYLDEQDVPDEGRAWFGDPSTKADIMKIDKFVRVDYGYGEQVPTGMFRKDIYGAPLLISNNLTAASTGAYGCYLHKDALAIAVQETPKSIMVEEPLEHQTVIQCEALWGVVEVMDTFGYPIYTRYA
jgi:hypothetical protein